MKSNRSLARTLALLGTLAAALVAAGRSVAYYTSFDREIGYFSNALLSTLLYIMPVLISALLLLSVLLAEPTSTPAQKYLSPAAVASAAAFLALGAYELLASLQGSFSVYALIRSLLALLAIPALLPLRKPSLRGLSGVCAVLYAILVVGAEYFDWTVPLNAPIKVYSQFTLLLLSLYVLALVRPNAETDRRRDFFAAPVAVFGITHGLSGVLAAFGGIFTLPQALIAFLSLAVGAHACARLAMLFVSTPHDPQQQISPTPASSEESPTKE